jgi:hypothetical protein
MPSWTLASAFLAALLMPGALVLLSIGPARIGRIAFRVPAAVLAAAAAWGLLLAAFPGRTLDPADLIAGCMILGTAAFCVYSAWALIVYGFTISMLVVLDEADAPLQLEDWARRYGGGRGLEAMLEDRLRVLLGMGLIAREGETVRLSGTAAKWFAGVVSISKRIVVGPEGEA